AHGLPRARHHAGGAGDAAARRLAADPARPAIAQSVAGGSVAPLLQVSELQTHYVSFAGERVVKAVDRVSFSLEEGETLGIVGESGCGKTTTCLSIVGLLPGSARIVGGHVDFAGQDLAQLSQREMRRVRGAQIAM